MSTTGYTHSEVFASLKQIKEEVKENYTTYQWLQVLDYFIESAIDPIADTYPDLADTYFAKVVAWQAHRPSVKYSRSDKFKLPIHLFNSLTTTGKDKRVHQKEMFLNRGLLFGLISLFQRTTRSFMRLHDPTVRYPKSQRMLLIELAVAKTSPYLYAGIQQSQFFADKAYWFKKLIVQKYVRHAIMSAKRTYDDTECKANLNDTIQVYLVFLSKAIDRCDARQGVLTTFITTWFYSAKAEVLKGVALESRTSSYDELLESGQDISVIEPDRKYETLQHLAVTARKLDPGGALRFAVGIPEEFSTTDRNILRAIKAQQSKHLQPKRSPRGH